MAQRARVGNKDRKVREQGQGRTGRANQPESLADRRLDPAGLPVGEPVAWLEAAQLPAMQRRLLAGQIGQVQGNRYLQRVFAPIQRNGPDDKTLAPATDPAEEAIRAQLNRIISPTDIRSLQDRKRTLILLFKAIPSPQRELLQDRLIARAKGDPLAELFHYRLATATRRTLVQVLSGEPVPLPQRTDPAEMTAFLPQVNADSFKLSADPVVIAPWMDTTSVTVSPAAEFSPPADSAGVALAWQMEDAGGAVVQDGRSDWPPGSVKGMPFVFQIAEPGLFFLKVSLVEGGFLVKNVQRDVPALRFESKGKTGEDQGQANLSAAREMSDAQLTEQIAELRQRMMNIPVTSGDSGVELPNEYLTLRNSLSALEWVARERGLPETPRPPIKGESLTGDEIKDVFLSHGGPSAYPFKDLGVTALSPDPAVLRGVLEDLVGKWGWGEVNNYVLALEERAPNPDQPLRSWDPEYTAKEQLGTRILQGLKQEIAILEQERKVFLGEFEKSAEWVFFTTLDQSEAAVKEAMNQYGVPWTPMLDQFLVIASAAPFEKLGQIALPTAPETQETTANRDALHQAAQELYAKKSELDELHAENKATNDHLIEIEHQASAHHKRKDDWDRKRFQSKMDEFYKQNPDLAPKPLTVGPHGVPFQTAQSPDARQPTPKEILEAARSRLAVAIEEKTRLYETLWLEKEIQYPILAAYRDGKDGLAELAKAESQQVPAVISKEIFQKLAAIYKSRYGLKNGKFSIWELPRIVEMAKVKMTVAPGSFRDGLVDDQFREANEPSWIEIAIIALSIGLAVVSFGATLPLAVELGALALNSYLAYKHVEKYEYGKALANTDFDTAKAISQEEPGLGWLAIELIGVGLGGVALISRFRQASQLRRLVIEDPADLERLQPLIDDLNKLGAERGLGNLGDEVIRRSGNLSDEAARGSAGGQVVTAGRQPLQMTADELTEFCQRLFSRPIRPMRGEAFFYDDYEKYVQAYKAKWPDLEPPSGGYYDPNTGHIHVSPRGGLLATVHEAIHKIAHQTFPMGRRLLGDFLDEGITEWITRARLGPHAGRHSYDLHVAFVRRLEDTVGTSVIENAMLHGSYRDLREAVKAALGGSEEKTFEFFSLLRRASSDAGGAVSDRQALARAVEMLGGPPVRPGAVAAPASAPGAVPGAGPWGASAAKPKPLSQLQEDLKAFEEFAEGGPVMTKNVILNWMRSQGITGMRRNMLLGAIRAQGDAEAILMEGKAILVERTFQVPHYPARRIDLLFMQGKRGVLWESKWGTVWLERRLLDLLERELVNARYRNWHVIHMAYQEYLINGGRSSLAFEQFLRDWWILDHNPELVSIMWRADKMHDTTKAAMEKVGFTVHLTH